MKLLSPEETNHRNHSELDLLIIDIIQHEVCKYYGIAKDMLLKPHISKSRNTKFKHIKNVYQYCLIRIGKMSIWKVYNLTGSEFDHVKNNIQDISFLISQNSLDGNITKKIIDNVKYEVNKSVTVYKKEKMLKEIINSKMAYSRARKRYIDLFGEVPKL